MQLPGPAFTNDARPTTASIPRDTSAISQGRPHSFPSSAEGQLAAVLWIAWDPIGGGTDEYVGYVPALLEMLRAEPSQYEVAAELERIRTSEMEVSADPRADSHAAWRILDWHFHFIESPDPPQFEPRDGWENRRNGKEKGS